MRKHRKFEKLSSKKLTLQIPCLSLKDIGSMVLNDVDFEVKARKGYYGNGSESYPIPRSFSVHSLATRAKTVKTVASESVAQESFTGTLDNQQGNV